MLGLVLACFGMVVWSVGLDLVPKPPSPTAQASSVLLDASVCHRPIGHRYPWYPQTIPSSLVDLLISLEVLNQRIEVLEREKSLWEQKLRKLRSNSPGHTDGVRRAVKWCFPSFRKPDILSFNTFEVVPWEEQFCKVLLPMHHRTVVSNPKVAKGDCQRFKFRRYPSTVVSATSKTMSQISADCQCSVGTTLNRLTFFKNAPVGELG